MTATFSIDEVREAFTSDVTGILGTIENVLPDLMLARALEPLGDSDGDPDAPTAFDRISDSCHAIAGTSGLVSATGLAETAQLLEDLTLQGAQALRELEIQGRRARRIGELCIDGVAALRTMLELELAGKQAEATRVAAKLAPALVEAGAGRPRAAGTPESAAVAAAAEADAAAAALAAADAPAKRGIVTSELLGALEFEFGEDSSIAETPVVEDELRELFQAEAAELMTELGRALLHLRSVPDDVPILSRAERIYHTLKGAAATVGSRVVAGIAEALQRRLDDAIAGDVELTAAELDHVITTTHELARLAGVDVSALPAVAGAQAEVDEAWSMGADSLAEPMGQERELERELAAIFGTEAQRELARLAEHVKDLERSPDDRVVAEQIERIFHTLKGAAATIGLGEIAATAAEMQHRFEAVANRETDTTTELLGLAVAAGHRIARAVGISAPPGLGAPVVTPPPAPIATPRGLAPLTDRTREDAHQFFVTEADAVCREILHLVPRLAAGAEGATTQAISSLMHRLKGSALLVGEQTVADECLRLQAMAESGVSGVPLQAAVTQGVTRIAQLLGIALQARPIGEATERTRRERVQLAVEPRLWEAFQQECAELLEQSDRLILELERTSSPHEIVAALLRNVHTLKGAINTIGLLPTGRALHLVEDHLEAIVGKQREVTPGELAIVLLDVHAEVRRHLDQAPTGWIDVTRLEARVASLASGDGEDRVLPPDPSSVASWASHASWSRGADPASASPGESWAKPSVATAASAASSASAAGSTNRSAGEGFEAVERRTLRVSTERLDSLMNLAGELVVSRSRLLSRVGTLRNLHGEIEGNRRRLIDTIDRFRAEHEFSQALRPAGGDVTGKRASKAKARLETRAKTPAAPAGDDKFTDLEMDRYDDVNVLARSLAELSDDVNAMDTALLRELIAFADDSQALGTIVSGIQSEVTRARMVPLETLFTRLRLPVRDVAEREVKSVRVVTQGEEVNLDKTIVDALFAPMLHIVRNAVAHGIEIPELRRARGKGPEGTITLSGRQEAGQIVVEIRDDGGGLDLVALHARGVAAGLIRPETPITDPSVRDLVFAAGISTREKAQDIAGRGVGGDVVRRAVERLNGGVRVESSPGLGTVFTITLPVTLAITRAVILQHGGQRYAVPLYFAERVLAVDEIEVVESAGSRRIALGDEMLPVRRLDELFSGRVAAPGSVTQGVIVVLRIGDERMGLEVEAVHGQEEVVVRHLGSLLDGHPLFTGMTIRGAGELVLILDAPGLVEAVHRKSTTAAAARTAASALPQAVLAAAVPAAPVAEPAKPRLRVLWVDDSLSVRRVAEKTLRGLGVDLDVTIAVDGVDALAKLREGTFDIVFTDLEMPRMHGYELIRELRYLPAYQAIPIVVVSSRSGQKHQKEARDAGANEFLSKPFTGEMLVRTLTRWGGSKAEALFAGRKA